MLIYEGEDGLTQRIVPPHVRKPAGLRSGRLLLHTVLLCTKCIQVHFSAVEEGQEQKRELGS
jgi:hypothetical protein